MTVALSNRFKSREARSQLVLTDVLSGYNMWAGYTDATVATLGVNGTTTTEIPVADGARFCVVVEAVSTNATGSKRAAIRRVYLVSRTTTTTTITSGTAEQVAVGAPAAHTIAVVTGAVDTTAIRIQFTGDASDGAGTVKANVRIIG